MPHDGVPILASTAELSSTCLSKEHVILYICLHVLLFSAQIVVRNARECWVPGFASTFTLLLNLQVYNAPLRILSLHKTQ